MSRMPLLGLLGGILALGGCAAAVTPVVALPSPTKDPQAFRADETECRKEAATAANPGAAQAGAAQTAPSMGNTNAQWQRYFTSYTQCEAARGNAVQPVPWTGAYATYLGYPATVGYGFGYGGGYGYGSPYGFGGGYGFGGYGFGYDYPFFYPGFVGFYGAGFGYGRFGGGFGHYGGGFGGGGHFGGGGGGGGGHFGGGSFHH